MRGSGVRRLLAKLFSRVRPKIDQEGRNPNSDPQTFEEQLVTSLGRDQPKLMARANRAAISDAVILDFARRLEPDVTDLEQAPKELARSIEVALDIMLNGREVRGQDAFVGRVLIDVAKSLSRNDIESGVQAIANALSEVEGDRSAPGDEARLRKIALYNAGAKQHALRRDARAVAEHFEKLVAEEYAADIPAWHPKFRAKYEEYLTYGDGNDINFPIDVAIECGRLILKAARDSDERGTAAFLLGNALTTRGLHDQATGRLQEAVNVYSEGLTEWDADNSQRQRDAIQSHLDKAKALLVERTRVLSAD
jgi:tetratricopeptide (TPR) repeat protein